MSSLHLSSSNAGGVLPHVVAERIGVMVCGHGSRDAAAITEFADLVAQLPAHLPDWPVAHGYLEFADPVIRDGLDRLRTAGCGRILAVPGMLFAAMHAKNDIPSVLNTYAAEHGIRIDYGRELGLDAGMMRAAGDRVRQAIARADAADGPVPLAETCLVVIGRGASDPDANANVAKVCRLLWEGMGFGWGAVGYSGVTFPLVAPTLEHVARLGFRRVVVFPYFLFTGVLVDRIYGFTDEVAADHPEIAFVKAGYLGDHPAVLQTFAERATEILSGDTAMNCGLCKYRTRILGFEAEVGLPQASHHHHAEGAGAAGAGPTVADCDLCDSFCTGACRLEAHHHHGHHQHDDHHHHDGQGNGHHHHGDGHDHHHHDGPGGHHHHPYPHAAHPLGPESVRGRGHRR